MRAFSTVAPDPDEVRAHAARRSRRRTASATSGGGSAINMDELRNEQGGEYSGHHEQDQAAGSAGKIDGKKKKSLIRKKGGTTVKGETSADDGMAYGEDFRRVCNELKITHVLCPAHRPEIHGLAERWNRTVTKMANSMLFRRAWHISYGQKRSATRTCCATGSQSGASGR
jgi:hypothetical protein